MMRDRVASTSAMTSIVSLATFLFWAPIISTPGLYSIGAVMLLLAGIAWLFIRERTPVQPADKVLLATLAAICLAGAISWLYHRNPARELDLYTRYAMLIPIIILLIERPPRPAWIWAAVIAGSTSGAALAAWLRYVKGDLRIYGFTGGIQFGDLALMLAIFCAVGLVWACRQPRRRPAWMIATSLGVAAGVYASLMSGTRAAWCALPVAIILFLIALVNRQNIRKSLLWLAAACGALALVAANSLMVHHRYREAVEDYVQFQHGNVDTSVGLRLDLWQTVAELIGQRPLMGWSMSDYETELARRVAMDTLSENAFRLANTHNTFLEILVHQGLFVLIPLIFLLIFCFIVFLRHIRSTDSNVQLPALAGALLIACYVVFSQTQIMLGRTNTLYFFLISLGVYWGWMRHGRNQAGRKWDSYPP